MPVTVVHDLDFPIYSRKTSLRRIFWLTYYILFGWSQKLRKRLPRWFVLEKYYYALALAEIDRLLEAKAFFGLTKEVQEYFPELWNRLEKMGFEVRDHFHIKGPPEYGKGRWDPPLPPVKRSYATYDRRYTFLGKKDLPPNGTTVAWHVDHPLNLYDYIDFVKRCKKEGLM
ncbi:hypothetical protein E2P64_04870 [Candidatus Bathyarchaeota archaeon]|nr:hypothetical protein E2P64_04870 [Candidatus Bathyarchaeota archaeon]